MKKRLIIATLALMLSVNMPAYASPTESEYDEIITKIQTIESDSRKLNCDIEDTKVKIEKVNLEMENSKEKIMSIREKIDEASEDIDKQAKDISEKVKVAYINGSNSTEKCIQVLLGSDSIFDLAQRFFAIRDVVSSSRDKYISFNESKLDLEKEEEKLRVENVKLTNMKSILEDKQKELVDKKSKQDELKEYYEDMKLTYQEELKQEELRVASIVEEIKEENNAGYNGSDEYVEENVEIERPTNGDIGSSIVSIAMGYLGTPYVWGGTTPSGFDCSGLTQYVYGQAGISLSRTTYTQIAQGYPVSELQPGDLVFFGSYSNPYHVGIYIGNGQYLHAPQPGDVVKVSSLQYSGDYCGGRRYY